MLATKWRCPTKALGQPFQPELTNGDLLAAAQSTLPKQRSMVSSSVRLESARTFPTRNEVVFALRGSLQRTVLPQEVPQTGVCEDSSEMQKPLSHKVTAQRHSIERRERDSNPRSGLIPTHH
jgi:hypothetical protein